MKPLHEWTLEDVRNTPPSTVIYTEEIEPGRAGTGVFVIARGVCSLCGYVCVPVAHPLAALDFDIDEWAHWGESYDAQAWWSGEWWAWGWDYGHAGDLAIWAPPVQAVVDTAKANFLAEAAACGWTSTLPPDRAWLPLDVWADARALCDELPPAMRAAEAEAARRMAAGEPAPEPRQGRTMATWEWMDKRGAAASREETPQEPI